MAAAAARHRVAAHEGFLRHKRFRWLKVALAASIVATAAYALIDVEPRPNGGSAYGYLLGTVSVLLILWLAMLGIRKRAMTRGRWSLKAWTSAHVYLGLSLVVMATLHTGFQFGWNVHTLAYALMMLVIASGIYGVIVYAVLPAELSNSRGGMTRGEMLEAIAAVDRLLQRAAQPLDQRQAALVQAAIAEDPFAPGLVARLSGRMQSGATDRAIAAFSVDGDDAVLPLLERKAAVTERLHRHLHVRTLLEVWLYVHVPLTFALIAALIAHIVSVFFYW